MKKILLLALAFVFVMTIQAQVILNEGFENNGFPYSGWGSSGFGSSTTPCSGTRSISASFTTSYPNNSFISPFVSSNGNAHRVQISYRNMTSNNGNVDLTLFYVVNFGPTNTIATWTTPGNMTSCATITAFIPEGAAPNGSFIKVGVSGTRNTSNSGSSTVIIDNLIVNRVNAPVISGISQNALVNNATITYTLNPDGGNATSVINYGLSPSNLNQTVSGFAANGSTTTNSVQISGLSAGTQYYYQIEATNQQATVQSSIQSFTTYASAPTLSNFHAYYPFNNSRSDIGGNNPFAVGSSSFVADRNGNASSALRLPNVGTTATIPGLSYGSAPSTIAFWVKFNSISTFWSWVYSYGATNNGNGVFMTDTNIAHTSVIGHTAAATHVANTWYHYAFVYNGSESKIYRNGVLLSTASRSWIVLNNSNIFRIGQNDSGSNYVFDGDLDDLIIYNFELTASQIADLYNNNLAVDETIQRGSKFTLYPNPTNDRIFISGESTIRRAEVYSVLGQSLLATKENEISLEHLPQGIYFIKIEDEEWQLSTHKVVKK